MRWFVRPATGLLLAALVAAPVAAAEGQRSGKARAAASDPPPVPPGALRIVNHAWHSGRVAVCAEEPGAVSTDGSQPWARTRVWIGDGPGFRKVTASAASCDPAWSPEGDRLAVVTPDGLWVLSADLRRATHLVDLRPRTAGAGVAAPRSLRQPQWAPDASALAAVASDGISAWVEVVDARTGAPLFTSVAGAHDFTWAPDSRALHLGSRVVRLPAAAPHEDTRTERCH
jgi:hypothetical protein